MIWHAADMPRPAGAVQTFGTLEVEPPRARPHSPCPGARHCFPCHCSSPAPEPTFRMLPSLVQISFQHRSPALVLLSPALSLWHRQQPFANFSQYYYMD